VVGSHIHLLAILAKGYKLCNGVKKMNITEILNKMRAYQTNNSVYPYTNDELTFNTACMYSRRLKKIIGSVRGYRWRWIFRNN
jgi:hypothetical protein